MMTTSNHTFSEDGLPDDAPVRDSRWSDEQIAALCSSLEYWLVNYELAAQGKYAAMSVGAEKCACCVEYAQHKCIGCPIAITTGESYCTSTPYYEALKDTQYTLDAVRDEYAMLAELLVDGQWEASCREGYVSFGLALPTIQQNEDD